MTQPNGGQQQDTGTGQQQDTGQQQGGGSQQGGTGQQGPGSGQQQDLDAPKFSQKWANDFEARLRREYATKADKDKELIERGKEYEALLAESQPLSERVETLSGAVAEKDNTIASKDLEIRRLQLAWDAGLPPAVGRRVVGNNDDEINADIEALKRDLNLTGTGQQQRQGGSGVRPNPQQGVPSSGDTNRTGNVDAGRSLWEQKHGKKANA